MIEGQAGTGKSTVLAAVARVHQQTGRRVVVTSTGALAAERLACDLRAVGVDARAYSTATLKAHRGRLAGDRPTAASSPRASEGGISLGDPSAAFRLSRRTGV